MSVTPADPTLRDAVHPVVAELVERVPAAAGHLMLVGALCRDVLHREAGHTFALRRTLDLDLALAVDDWDRYSEIVDELPAVRGAAQVRYDLAGVKVDLVPFGGVEQPDGAVPLQPGVDPLDVLGFGDVWNAAREVALGDDLTIRLPTIPGYTALKLAAWATRSTNGEYKDAGDLACAAYWYLHSASVEDRLYSEERGQRILTDAWSRDRTTAVVASTVLLAEDAMAVLTPSRRAELLERWDGVDDNLLATYSDNSLLPGWPPRASPGLAEHARSLRAGLTGPESPVG